MKPTYEKLIKTLEQIVSNVPKGNLPWDSEDKLWQEKKFEAAINDANYCVSQFKSITFGEVESEFKSLHIFDEITHDGRCINIWKGNTRVIEVMSRKVTYLVQFGKVGKPCHDFLTLCMRYLESQQEE